MASKQSEELIDEAHDNLKDDRSKIKEFSDLLIKAISIEENVDPLAKISLSESFARLSGELNKNNSLLIELAKLRVKKESVDNPNSDDFDEEETESMFDEIGGTTEEEGSN